MTKKELIDSIAGDLEITKKDAERAYDAVVDGIIKSVKSGEGIALPGLGSFKPHTRKARTARNPSTGAEIKVPKKNVVKFKAAKAFLDELN